MVVESFVEIALVKKEKESSLAMDEVKSNVVQSSLACSDRKYPAR